MWNREPIGGPFALIDHTGKRRTDADFRGKLLLVYFGFTYCPDVCPTDLQDIGLALDKLGAAGDQPSSRCSSRSIPSATRRSIWRDYVALFHPRLIGLTGDAAAIHKPLPMPTRSITPRSPNERRRPTTPSTTPRSSI